MKVYKNAVYSLFCLLWLLLWKAELIGVAAGGDMGLFMSVLVLLLNSCLTLG